MITTDDIRRMACDPGLPSDDAQFLRNMAAAEDEADHRHAADLRACRPYWLLLGGATLALWGLCLAADPPTARALAFGGAVPLFIGLAIYIGCVVRYDGHLSRAYSERI